MLSSVPRPATEAEPDGESEPPRQSQSERVDGLAEVGVDAAQVQARIGGAASVHVELWIDALVAGPMREVPHRGLQRDVVQPEPLARGGREAVCQAQLAPPQELAI